MVVLYHLTDGSLLVGAAGVDIFFVVSGFMMGTAGAREKPLVFAAKRIKRIVPLYWLVTLTMCLASIFGLFRHFAFDLSALLKSLLFIPYVDPISGHAWPLVVPGWTLNYEMFFYVVFAIGLVAGRPVLMGCVVTLLLGGLGLFVTPASAPLQIWTSPLLWEFAGGLLLSQLDMRFAALGGLFLIMGGIFVLAVGGNVDVFNNGPRMVRWGPAALMIVSGALAIERNGKWPTTFQPFARLGDASYSLYLLHGLVVEFGFRVLGKSLGSKTLIFGVSIALALVSFRYLERPISRFRMSGVRRFITVLRTP